MAGGSDPLPFLTSDLPGSGGRIKDDPDDFIVEEVPLYEPSGAGTHLYLRIEKKGIPTFEAVQRLARELGRSPRDFGVAGLKDAAAVTRQYVSIEHTAPDAVKGLAIPGVRILEAKLHKNKLKKGHLKGNRFRITVRDPAAGGEEKARAVLARLAARGVPNYFGTQRFGLLGNTHRLGALLLRGDFEGFSDELIGAPRDDLDPGYGEVISHFRRGEYLEALRALRRTFRYERRVLEILLRTGGDHRKAALSLDRRIIDLYLAAYQSHLFNRLLAMRIEDIDSLTTGDVAFIHRNGACFLVEDAGAEAPRAERFEISPSGPLYGTKLLRAAGEPGRMEDEILLEEGIALDDFRKGPRLALRGARRPLRIPLADVQVTSLGNGDLALAFELPPGGYATVVLAEVMKPSAGGQ
jgi:tRNA pseudouridine13 synthase